MKKYSLKKSLVASVLMIAICITSLIGTTFAWFTDSVSSSGNKVVAGSLKIDLELHDKENDKWNSIKESQAPIFNYEYWEPGYVDAKLLKVENEGNLALKWKAKFVSDTALGILADAIDVYVKPSATELTYPASRDLIAEGYVRAGTIREFVNTIESTTYGVLEKKGDVAYLGIALKMQEGAGNDYQAEALGAFDIQIVATQLSYEGDSFGPDYDANAPYPVVSENKTLPDSQSVTDILLDTNEGTQVNVPADAVQKILENTTAKEIAIGHSEPKIDTANNSISFDNFDIIDENGIPVDLEAMNNTVPVTVVINVGDVFEVGDVVVIYHDGEVVASAAVSAEKTVSYTTTHFCKVDVSFGDGKIDNEIEVGAALANGGDVIIGAEYVDTTADATHKNDRTAGIFFAPTKDAIFSAKKVTLTANTNWGFVPYLNNGVNVTVKDSVFTSNGPWLVHGIVGEGSVLTLDNIKVLASNGTGIYAFPITSNTGSVILNNCYVEQDFEAANPAWADTAVAFSGGINATINGGNYVGTGKALYIYNSGATVTINGGNFKAPVALRADGCWNSNANAIKSIINVNGGNFDGAIETDWGDKPSAINIYGGTFTNFSTIVKGGKITIYGGNFDSDPSAHVAEGFKAYQLTDGTWMVDTDMYVARNGDKFYAKLNNAVNEVEDGDTIVVLSDITFSKNDDNYYNNGGYADGLGIIGDKSFTLDLNGKTLTNDSTINDYLIFVKNNGAKPNTVTIKNGTLDATSTAYCALCTSSSHSQKLTIDLENVELYNNISNGSTLKVRGGSELNVKAGTKITGRNSYLAIENWKSTVNIYDGAELYMNGKSSYNGCLAGTGGGGVINVYGGYGKGVKGGFIAMTSGGTINVYGGEWIANTDGSIGDNSNLYVLTAQSNIYEGGFAGGAYINVYGGTFRGGMDAWVLNNVAGEEAKLNISGGNFNANPQHYIADGYVNHVNSDGSYSVVKEGAVVVKNATELRTAVEGGAKVVFIEPGVDLGSITHILVKDDLTIYGNGATVGGETFAIEFRDGTATPFTKDVTLTIYDLDGVTVWGDRKSEYAFNLILDGCDDARIWLQGGPTTTNVYMNNCNVTKAGIIYDTAIYVNSNGTIEVENCTFSGIECVFNLNHKFAGEMNVIVKNCEFIDCATTGSAAHYAPIRLCNSVDGASQTLSVEGCSFFYSEGKVPVNNADVLLNADTSAVKGSIVANVQSDATVKTGDLVTLN